MNVQLVVNLIAAGVIVVCSVFMAVTMFRIGRAQRREAEAEANRVDLVVAQLDLLRERVDRLERGEEPEPWDTLGRMPWTTGEDRDEPR